MSDKEYDKYALTSLWFPFVNEIIIAILTFVSIIFLVITTNIEEVYFGLMSLISCVGLILNIRYSVKFGFKSKNKKIIAVIGILISLFFILFGILFSLMQFVDVKIGLSVKIGESPIILIVFIYVYKKFLDKVFKTKKTERKTNAKTDKCGAKEQRKKSNRKKKEKEEEENMGTVKYYYNFGEVGSKDEELENFEQLTDKFNEFEKVFANKDPKLIQPALSVTAKPRINGVEFITATRLIAKALFSNKLKIDELVIEAAKVEDNGKRTFYTWYTTDIEEFKRIFYEFVVNESTPDFSSWEENIFMSD